MTCQNCSAEMPEGQKFCGNCGHGATAVTLISLHDRVAKIETQLAADSQSKLSQQNYLEQETAVNVIARVKRWTTQFLYFASIPAAIALFALAVIWGHGSWDLYRIGANAKTSVQLVLDQARIEASNAERTAKTAKTTASQVNGQVQEIQRRVTELKSDVENRSVDVQRLNRQITDSHAQVEGLSTALRSQAQQVANISQQLKMVETQKNVTSLTRKYPSLFGEHVVESGDGRIEPKPKSPDETYLVFALYNNGKPSFLNESAVAEAIQSLKDHHYEVTMDQVHLQAESDSGGEPVGNSNLDSQSCELPEVGIQGPPCILYLNEKLKAKAFEVRNLVSGAQFIRDDRIRYVSPSRMEAPRKELLHKFALDILVVLGRRN